MENKALWQRVCVTDPKAVKAITGKQYQGNSPKPYWIVERLTDEFGPCGIGWGFTILNERMERLTDTDVLHVAVISFWYVLDGTRGELQQIGQTKAVYAKRDGGLMVDEDAPKKSVTDALVKCASYIGFAGDIFAGRWDDSKYVQWAAQQYQSEPAKPEVPAMRHSPTKGVIVDDKRRNILADTVIGIQDHMRANDTVGAFELCQGITDAEEKTFVWSQLSSEIRRLIKAHGAAIKEAA